jgi:hypothetical protein
MKNLLLSAALLAALSVPALAEQVWHLPGSPGQLPNDEASWVWGDSVTIMIDEEDELIECSPGSNVYKTIKIYRRQGIPRYATVTDCNQQQDTVWYFPDSVRKCSFGGSGACGIGSMSITADTMVAYSSMAFSAKVMDVETGAIVFEQDYEAQEASKFQHTGAWSVNNTHKDGNSTHSDGSLSGNIDIPTDDNEGVLIDYRNLPNGIYFLVIFNEYGEEIAMWKFRKGI